MPRRSLALPVALLSLFASTAAPLSAQVRAVGQKSERVTTRVFHFKSKPTFTFTVQYAITYGAPVWKKRFSAALAAEKGKAARFRLGKDFWTTLDTNSDLVIGGVRVPAGLYYLVLERTAEGEFNVVALDAATIRKKRLDALRSAKTIGGIAIPMLHHEMEKAIPALEIELVPGKADPAAGRLNVRWGPHLLTAETTVPGSDPK